MREERRGYGDQGLALAAAAAVRAVAAAGASHHGQAVLAAVGTVILASPASQLAGLAALSAWIGIAGSIGAGIMAVFLLQAGARAWWRRRHGR
jgi:hypothetical protein